MFVDLTESRDLEFSPEELQLVMKSLQNALSQKSSMFLKGIRENLHIDYHNQDSFFKNPPSPTFILHVPKGHISILTSALNRYANREPALNITPEWSRVQAELKKARKK